MSTKRSPDRSTAPIVVGVDDTPASCEALAFALREGASRGTRVDVVTAWEFEGPYDGWLDHEEIHRARDKVKKMQAEALTEALSQVTARPLLTHTVVEGAAGRILVEAAHDAWYLVVGSAHKSLARRALLGSVSHYCVQHAAVPVVVVPGPAVVTQASATAPGGVAAGG